jgi:hypothetical protein
MAVDPLESCTGFEWDDANSEKNWELHRVTPEEAEDIFFQEPLVMRSDVAIPGVKSGTMRWARHRRGDGCFWSLLFAETAYG